MFVMYEQVFYKEISLKSKFSDTLIVSDMQVLMQYRGAELEELCVPYTDRVHFHNIVLFWATKNSHYPNYFTLSE
jgi:hypothetical protein